jgi:hypothetical protein
MTTIRSTRMRGTSLVSGPRSLGLVLPACDILDVNNPNNLTEEEHRVALRGLGGGERAQWRRTRVPSPRSGWAISSRATRSRGSARATPGASSTRGSCRTRPTSSRTPHFPQVAQARWLADRATEILDGHVAETPTAAMRRDSGPGLSAGRHHLHHHRGDPGGLRLLGQAGSGLRPSVPPRCRRCWTRPSRISIRPCQSEPGAGRR